MDKVEEVLIRGVEKIYPSKEELEKVLRSGKKIRLYQGFDPTMPNLHLGNLVGVFKLKQFQDLGHEVIFLVGDFTGMIGDPTDKPAVRKQLTREQVLKNCCHWKKKIEKILNFTGKNAAKFLFNSSWLDNLNFKDIIKIATIFTVQQMLERDFFQKRLKRGYPIYLHELLYPLAQSIDSLKMEVDLEIGGSDQTFNMLCGRTLMKNLKGKEKFVLTTKLLIDSKGKKIGKTTGNALFLNAPATEMFGGIMSFPDEAIEPGFELLTLIPLQKIIKKRSLPPMIRKKQLAFEIIKILYGKKQAKTAQEEFEKVFQKKKVPSIMPVIEIKENKILLPKFLANHHLVSSISAAKRLLKQGGIDINGKTLKIKTDESIKIEDNAVIQIGKRKFAKIKIKK